MFVFVTIIENRIDSKALMALTERGMELLIPIIGDRMKFIEVKKSFPKDIVSDMTKNVDEFEVIEDDPLQDGVVCVDSGEGTSAMPEANIEPVAVQEILNTSARFVKILFLLFISFSKAF